MTLLLDEARVVSNLEQDARARPSARREAVGERRSLARVGIDACVRVEALDVLRVAESVVKFFEVLAPRRLVGEGAQVLSELLGLLTLVRVRLNASPDLARVARELGVARHRAEGGDVHAVERLTPFDELSDHVDGV